MGKIFLFNDIFPENKQNSTPKSSKQTRGIRLNIILKMIKDDPELINILKKRLEPSKK